MINKYETIKAILHHLGIRDTKYLYPAEKAIVNVVESMPEHRGQWEHERANLFKCSVCGETHVAVLDWHRSGEEAVCEAKYCQNCGAYMKGEQE